MMIKLSTQTLFMCLCVWCVVDCSQLVAQTSIPATSIGIYGGGALNMHRGVLTTNEGVLECGRFENASSLRWFVGNQLNFAMSDNMAASIRLYYHKANGTFEANNQTQPLVSLSDGSLVPLKTRHTLDVALDYLTADALGQYFVSPSVYGLFGVSIGIATRNAFEQNESIESPSGATFLDGSSSRRIIAGPFSDANGRVASNSLRIAGVVGAGLYLPINSQLILNPELSFQYSALSVLPDAQWSVHAVRAGAGLLYVLGMATAAAPPPPPPPPPPPAAPLQPIAPAAAVLDVYNVNDAGSAESYAEIAIHDHRTLDILPLLPYIFFDPGSGALPGRYRSVTSQTRQSFSENQLPNDQLRVYYDVLNIIGSRMNRYPQATIVCTGCIDPVDDGASSDVAMARAQSVKSYLVSVWGIDESRIRTSTRALPEVVSNRTVADGRTENRRTEISSTDERILAPVFIRASQRSVKPAALRLSPTVAYQGTLRSVVHTIRDSDGKVLATRETQNADAIDVPIASLGLGSGKSLHHVQATVAVTTDSGVVVERERMIPVRRSFSSSRANAELVKDTVIERYSMLLFNFDRASTIAGSDEQVMRLIRSRVRTTSGVHIEGMTDYIGAKDKNQKLSEARAAAVRNDILSRIKPEQLTTRGLGEVDLFDNTLPEGRFYNRRVFVEIETPLVPDVDDEGGLP